MRRRSPRLPPAPAHPGSRPFPILLSPRSQVFNYWEPLHYLLYGHGMQTWEYRWEPRGQHDGGGGRAPRAGPRCPSGTHIPPTHPAPPCSPQFALRPYAYLLLHAIVAGPAALLAGPGRGKATVWYVTRGALGAASAAAETALYGATLAVAGPGAAVALLVLLLGSAGMFAGEGGFGDGCWGGGEGGGAGARA